MTLKAIIFDVDGTLAETEEAHRTAFNRAFAEAGRPWVWSQEAYRGLLQVTGGEERMRHFLAAIGEPAPATLIADLHRRKNAAYAGLVAANMVALRPGVARLIDEARVAGIRLGIATTTSRSNLFALLASAFPPGATAWFDAIVTGEMVRAKKPDPEAYLLALEALRLPADACVAVEDSRNGLAAALACGIATVITRSFYLDQDDFAGAAMICRDLETPPVGLADLEALLRGASDGRGVAMAIDGASPVSLAARPFDVVVFDLDGTLADTSADLAAALNHALAALGRPTVAPEQVRQLVGHGTRELLRKGLAITGGADAESMARGLPLLLAHYEAHICDETVPYPGIEAALDRLTAAGARLAICTNKPERLSRKLVAALGWDGRFAAIVGGDTLGRSKPDPAPAHEAIARAGGGRAAYVGDSITDAETARAARLPFIAVGFGFRDRPVEQLGADAVIHHFDELVAALERIA